MSSRGDLEERIGGQNDPQNTGSQKIPEVSAKGEEIKPKKISAVEPGPKRNKVHFY